MTHDWYPVELRQEFQDFSDQLDSIMPSYFLIKIVFLSLIVSATLVLVGFFQRRELFLIMVRETMEAMDEPNEYLHAKDQADVYFKVKEYQPFRSMVPIVFDIKTMFIFFV